MTNNVVHEQRSPIAGVEMNVDPSSECRWCQGGARRRCRTTAAHVKVLKELNYDSGFTQGTEVVDPDVYLLTVETAAERWSSRPEGSWPVLGRGAGLGPVRGLVLRRQQARRQGPDLGLDKAGSPVTCGCGGEDNQEE